MAPPPIGRPGAMVVILVAGGLASMWGYVWSGTTEVTCVATAPRDVQCHVRVRALGVATDRDVVAHAVRAVTVDRHDKNVRLYLDTPSGLVELPHGGEPALTPFADELDALVSGRRESASLAPRRHSAGDWVGFAVLELLCLVFVAMGVARLVRGNPRYRT